MTIETYGLTHVALSVADVERSFRFYQRLLGAKLLGNDEGRDNDDLTDRKAIEFGTPGCRDVVVLMRSAARPRAIRSPSDVDEGGRDEPSDAGSTSPARAW